MRSRLVLGVGVLFCGYLAWSLTPPRAESEGKPQPPEVSPADGSLHLTWVREVPCQSPAWPDQVNLQFDLAPEPVLHEDLVFVPGSETDSLQALEADTGKEVWRFVAEGPIRFAPSVWQERVYVASDDGHLYCLDAETGHLHWKKRGGPSDRKVLGNSRLISTWPARGAPVVATHPGTDKPVVYFAAGIWPFMGIFLHALDAETGEAVWINDGDGAIFIKQPHNADAFAGVAPQGRLVVFGDQLLVPSGRSVPACYDRRTGKLVHFRLAEMSKKAGGWKVQAAGGVFLNNNSLFDIETGDLLSLSTRTGPIKLTGPSLLGDNRVYALQKDRCVVFDMKEGPTHKTSTSRGQTIKRASWEPAVLTQFELPPADLLIKHASHLYGASRNKVFALDGEDDHSLCWEAPLAGQPVHLAADDDRVIVSTKEGRIYCYGRRRGRVVTHRLEAKPPTPRAGVVARARELLEKVGVREGYAVVWGIESGELLAELRRQSDLRVIAIEEDREKVEEARAYLRRSGVSPRDVSVLEGDPEGVMLPPYLASAMICTSPREMGVTWDADLIERMYTALRPFGGRLLVDLDREQADDLCDAVKTRPVFAQAKFEEGGLHVIREGALPESGNWTHEHGDPANTRVARDRIVKAPLGLLWFGGISHEGVLPRHGHGPQPQVIDGRLIYPMIDGLRAIDIYTGRLLWETKLPGLGKVYNNTAHQPGANAMGTNYVSTSQGIYVAYQRSCLCLDPATGQVTQRYHLPTFDGEGEPPLWAYLNVAGDYLIGGTNAQADLPRQKPTYMVSSGHLFVLDRKTGEVLWQKRAAHGGFRHNGLCVGSGRLFAIDRTASLFTAWPKRGSKLPESEEAAVVAFDLKSGEELWRTGEKVFGTWLSYSEEHDVLVEAGNCARDTLGDEPKGMRAYKGSTGKPLWHQAKYAGPPMIHGNRILKDRDACELLTGLPIYSPDPITGELVVWKWARTYGCNTPMASEHLLTFRSGAAGYYDLCNEGGTGNFGGFRSGCSNNLMVAGGVLTAPDYTRTCTCSYQNQTSIALVPMADAEMWTFQGSDREIQGPVRKVGLLLGAPGNRKDEGGTLWLSHPSPGKYGPELPVELELEKPEWFRVHPSRIEGEGPSWIGSSGVRGLRSLKITLADDDEKRTYRVRLIFTEPDNLAPGQRVFDVAVQGETVLENVDVIREAGGAFRMLSRDIDKVEVENDLTIRLLPKAEKGREPVLSGVEIRLVE